LITPVCEIASPELVLSTFAHELGHAVFEAPGWIHEAAQGAGLFDDPALTARKAYRTSTPDAEHLSKSAPVGNAAYETSVRFAEFRANEFMGSLLVPRQHLMRAVEVLAEHHSVTITRGQSIDPDFPGMGMTLTAKSSFGFDGMDPLLKALATRFGVTPKFIRVRMNRYGLLKPGAKNY
jgi:Zn-dependent peptidase ImmA (M78 family)